MLKCGLLIHSLELPHLFLCGTSNLIKILFLKSNIHFKHFSGDPSVFGNLEPCDEIVDAVMKCIKEAKHNGYSPSTGTGALNDFSPFCCDLSMINP